ncbi:MAG: DNA gyrase subunit A [Phycisphaerae bacterium]|nr:DNA gyrase subunit A [Phycisphaerae bacterium]
MSEIEERTENQPITSEMKDSYLTYAMSVIMSRALPDARDGLKPSQRRILVAMNDLNVGPRGAFRKCANIVGECMGNYHPHGEVVIYPTLVRMGQHWSMRHTLITPQGNFGSIDGDPPAAMRYTEARMAPPAADMLADLDLDTVDFQATFDDRNKEPVVLPSKFPNLLVNGSTGIAVGMATNLPPHNLGEVCDAVVKVVDNPNVTIEELMEVLPGPDFPTGATICGRKGIHDLYTTGRGSITLRSKMHVEEMRGGREMIVVDEIPYQILKTTILERMALAVKDGTITEISHINDASGRKHPCRIEIELKKDGNADVVMNQLYQHTSLQTNFTAMNLALVHRQPRQLTLKQLIEEFVAHRKQVIRRRTRCLLQRASERAHILEGLILAVGDIDEIIQIIRQSPDPPTAKKRLMAKALRLTEQATLRALLPEAFLTRLASAERFLTSPQADAILSMQLQRLTGLEIEKLARDYARLAEEIEGYEAILRDEALVLDIIREDMFEMKDKYANPRRTDITGSVTEFSMEELVAEELVVVSVTNDGYVKRTPIDTYRKQGRGGRGVIGAESKEGDFVRDIFAASTHDYLLIFTNRGRIYWLKVYDVPSMSRTSRGRSIANLIKMQQNEEQRAVLAVRAFEERFVIFATSKGVIKKTPLQAFSHPRPSGIIALTLDPDDQLIDVAMTQGEDQIVLGSRNGQAIRFSETDVRAMGRGARGVKGMTLTGDDRVVDMVVPRPNASLLTVCEKGFGKRTPIDDYRITRRGGKGVINIRVTERNGRVVALKAVEDEDELMVITANGIMLRTDLSALREIGRATQGVKIIRVDDGDRVAAVARIARDEDDVADEETGQTATAEIVDEPTGTAVSEQAAGSTAPGAADAAPGDEEDLPAADADSEAQE